MTIRVAINGFGRIGRLVFRAYMEANRKDIDIVAINDLGSAQENAHLLNYDSVHGNSNLKISVSNNCIIADGQTVKVMSVKNPADLPWKDLGIDVVAECTGIFSDRDQAGLHLKAGAKRVLISAPSKVCDVTVVYGVNHDKIKKEDLIISNASCTTNCLAPVAQVLNNEFGIEYGYMTTIHSFTGDQRTVDTLHKDMRRARAASISMIPTSTGAARAVGEVLPELAGRLDGSAIRVPTPNVSMIDFKCLLKTDCKESDINASMLSASKGYLKDILKVNDLPLVSIDFNHNSASSIFDSTQTKLLENRFLRVVSWYDNEWGFSNRMLDSLAKVGSLL